MDKLVQLSDHEIRIDFALASKCRTTIHLTSLISSAPLAFKVQTSSPHKFLVNPPSGLLHPLASAAFQIVLKPQSQIPPNFPRSPSDRFLVKTAVAPDLRADQPESGQSEIVNRWFNSTPHRSSYDVKLKVYFVGPFLLGRAAGAGDFEAVKGIIKRQRCVVSDLSAQEAESLYQLAKPYPDVMGLLIDAGLRVLEVPSDARWASRGWTELHVAAAFDRTAEVERLVEERGGLELIKKQELRDREGRGPLQLVASKGHLGSAKVLVGAGGDVDSRSGDCQTVENGDRHMVEMLLNAEADPTFDGVEWCRSANNVARDKGHMDIVKVHERGDAVFHAARRGELDALVSILENGAATDFCDEYGFTALHVAAMKGYKDVVMMLVEFGADVECPDAEGHTPLHLAVEGGSIETVEILINGGARVNAKTRTGATLLHIAKLMEHEGIARLLLDSGASSSPHSVASSFV